MPRQARGGAAPRATNQRGVAAVELALILPLLILLFVGVGLLMRGYYVNLALVNAARAGAQYAVNTRSEDTAAIAAAAKRDAADLPDMPAPEVSIRKRCADDAAPQAGGLCAGGGAPRTYVEVSAGYTLELITYGLLPGVADRIILNQRAIMRTN